jgi:hypothetical protein
MDEQPLLPATETKEKLPRLLTILCILTFIGSGINLFSSTIIFLFFDTFKTVAADVAKAFKLPGMDLFINAKPVFFLVSAGIYAVAIGGAIRMWHLHKDGFHIYTFSQILLIISPMYFFKLPGPSILDILFSSVFVLLYSMNLKKMH